MKPELANLYTINTSGKENDFILSFYYEWREVNRDWRETKNTEATEVQKQKVASVVLSTSDLNRLTDMLVKVREQLHGGADNE